MVHDGGINQSIRDNIILNLKMLSKTGVNLFNLYRNGLKLPLRLGFEHCCALSNSFTTSESSQNNGRKFQNKISKKFADKYSKEYEDTFGNLAHLESEFARIKDDPEDIEEYERDKRAKGKTIKQYIDEVKGYLNNNQYKEALKVLEEDVVNDRKKNVLFLYELMISYNGKQGNLKEAHRLYTNYKKRYKPLSSAMFTSLFNACANCSNSYFALEKADGIREYLMNNKFIKPNITNYNAMLKAYGRHGDLNTSLKIFDEVLEKRGKVLPITYAFLFQCCITDTNSGLRHALIIWRKMLQNRVKPNIALFRLLLRCVRDCSFGDPRLVHEAVNEILAQSETFYKRKVTFEEDSDGNIKRIVHKVPANPISLLPKVENIENVQEEREKSGKTANFETKHVSSNSEEVEVGEREIQEVSPNSQDSSLELVDKASNEESSQEDIQIQFVERKLEDNDKSLLSGNELSQELTLPNLISLTPTVGSVVQFANMTTPQERFKCLGGLEGFLKTMAEFDVKPDVKTLTLLLNLLPSTVESEEKIKNLAQTYGIKLDSAFFSVIINYRNFRFDNESVQDALKMMQKEGVSPDIRTFKALAYGCRTYESAKEIIETIHSFGFRLDNAIVKVLLSNADVSKDMKFVNLVVQSAKEDEVQPDARFIAHLGSIVRKEKTRRMRELSKKESENAGGVDDSQQSAGESSDDVLEKKLSG